MERHKGQSLGDGRTLHYKANTKDVFVTEDQSGGSERQ